MFPFLSFSLCLVFYLRASYFLATSLIHLKFYIKIVFNREQDAEEWVDVEYISLHGYIRNTPSNTEMHAEHQLRSGRSI